MSDCFPRGSAIQKTVALLVFEIAVVTALQDLMFVCCVIRSLGLKVGLPMKLEPDNSEAVYLAKWCWRKPYL